MSSAGFRARFGTFSVSSGGVSYLDFQMVFQDLHASLNPRMKIFSTLTGAVRQRRPELKGQALYARVDART